MKKQTLIIITFIILTNLSIGSADWISDNLPKSWQVDSIWRDQVKFIQEKTGTSTPIIFINRVDEEGAKASVLNIGIGPMRVAFMFIKQTSFQRHSFSENIHVLAHETVHVDQNHLGVSNTMFFGGFGMVGSSPLLKIAQLATATPLRAGRTLALGLCFTAVGLYHNPQDKKLYEYEAEEKSFEKIKQLGWCHILKTLSHDYAIMAKRNNQRPEEYPQYDQLHEWAKKAFLECQQNERK